MSYPSGPPGGYPGQPPQQGGGSAFGQPPAAPNPLGQLGIPGLLTLAVLVLALASYFCSFGGGAGIEVMTLLAGGLLAGLALIPKAPATMPFATVLSVVGGLAMLDTVINSSGGGVPTTFILILVLGLLQAIASVVVLLLEYGMIKLAPRPAVPHAAAGYQGGYAPQQPGSQQPGPNQQQSNQATTFMQAPQQQGQPQQGGPVQPQSTQFLQHPGQLSHRQPGEGSEYPTEYGNE
jgi:hypothetical protein